MFVIWIALEELSSKSFLTSIICWDAYNNLQFSSFGVKLLVILKIASTCRAAVLQLHVTPTLIRLCLNFAHL